MKSRGMMLYDYLAVLGGAEKLTLTFLEAFPGIPLCCGYRNRMVFPDSSLPASGLVDLNGFSRIPIWRILKVIRAFERKTTFLRDLDWALFSGSYAPMAGRNRPDGLNLLYCHTIPRFAYDLKDYYLSCMPLPFQPVFLWLVHLVRRRYSQALENMNEILVNSRNVQNRLRFHLGKSSTIINPPVDTDRFVWTGQSDYYVSLARLENFKRVDRIVEAFRRMPDKKLVVASDGSEMGRLRQIASGASNIHFLGWQTEARLREVIGNCIAAIYIPIDEDFGMSPVEAMAAGKPVIGVAEGGLLETVVPEKTGLLLSPAPDIDALMNAVRRLDAKRAHSMRSDCECQARQFGRDVFLGRMRSVFRDHGISFPSPGLPV
jgi:glycosyltransferase involved in cell wall biosynthesis